VPKIARVPISSGNRKAKGTMPQSPKSTAKANSVVETANPKRPIRMTGFRPITSLRRPQKALVITQSRAESE